MTVSIYPRQSRTVTPSKYQGRMRPNGKIQQRNRKELWQCPVQPSIDLQVAIEELTHDTGFSFAELLRMDAESEYAEEFQFLEASNAPDPHG